MNSPISIIPLTCEILEPLSLNPHKPHRHDHEELWIITHGSPSHAVDFMAEKLQSPVVVYIAQGKYILLFRILKHKDGLYAIKLILSHKADSIFIRHLLIKYIISSVKIIAVQPCIHFAPSCSRRALNLSPTIL